MTTITVVRKNGEVAIAADTLTKYGYTKESAAHIVGANKIFQSGENYIAVSGDVTIDMAIREYFASQSRPPRLDTTSRIFRVWHELHHHLKDKHFLNQEKDGEASVESSRVRALIANASGIFGVDPYRHVQEYTQFYAYGSGREFALGAMYALYGREHTAIEIARLSIVAAAEFDDSTGLPITSYAVRERRRPSSKAGKSGKSKI
jgi:ATP-dependent protease HslVU (ClpYQ) peptidase subunit